MTDGVKNANYPEGRKKADLTKRKRPALTRGRLIGLRGTAKKPPLRKKDGTLRATQDPVKKQAAIDKRKKEKELRRAAVARAMNYPLPEGYDYSTMGNSS